MANIALQSGLVDPGTQGNNQNSLIQTINSSIGGCFISGNITSTATGAGTGEQVLQTATLPANAITANGQRVRIKAWGTTAANSNNKTMKLYFGASVVTSGVQTISNKNWFLELEVVRTGAATQAVFGVGQFDTTNITPYVNAGTDDFTASAGIVIKCSGTDGTDSAGDIVCTAMMIEVLK